jgi:hypothetical protein
MKNNWNSRELNDTRKEGEIQKPGQSMPKQGHPTPQQPKQTQPQHPKPQRMAKKEEEEEITQIYHVKWQKK